MWDLIVRIVCVRERKSVCEDLSKLKTKEFSQVARY